MEFIIPLIYILCFTETLMLLFKTKFEHTLPLTFIISAIMLFISGFLFKTFYIGFILCIIFSLGFPIYLIKNRSKINLKKDYLTNGVIAFILLYLAIFILDFNRFFTRWDELSHWGKMVKEMYKLDTFYSIKTSSLLVHKDYPPIMSLLELFYSYLSFGFKESYLIRCMHLFECSLVLSIIPFKGNKIKDIAFKTFIPVIFIYLLTFLFDQAIVINSIYTDYVMAIFVAYLIYNIFKMDKLDIFNIISLSLSLIFLLLLKQVCIAFYLMIIFLLFINMILKKYKLKMSSIILSIILLVIVPILFLGIWKSYIKSLNIVGQFEVSDIKIKEVKNIKNNKNSWQNKAFNNYLKALYSKPILNSKIKVSYVVLGIILLVIVYLLYRRNKKELILKEYIPLSITLFGGYFGYALLMLMLYIFSFGEIEGVELASYERYMSTYILICLYVLVFIYISINKINIKEKKKYFIGILLVAVLIEPISYLKLRPDLVILKNHYFDIYENSAKLIDENIKDLDRVFILDQKENGGSVFYITYFSNKLKTKMEDYKLIVDSNDTYSLFYEVYYNKFKKYDYLYTYSIDDVSKEKYNFLCDEKLEEHTLYKIKEKDNIIYLEKVDELE